MYEFKITPKLYFNQGALGFAINELKNYKKIFILTTQTLRKSAKIQELLDIFEQQGSIYQVYFDIDKKVDNSKEDSIKTSLELYQPDVIVFYGVNWVINLIGNIYENKEVKPYLVTIPTSTEYLFDNKNVTVPDMVIIEPCILTTSQKNYCSSECNEKIMSSIEHYIRDLTSNLLI